ncbi:MAG: MaoC family dehydratase [Alphaproteobacteria bacterium]|nr:MaoC family dehydratase [Alphaproteobacteria bacterium]
MVSHPKSSIGQFFEDFRIGALLEHATPRTITDGDQALYTALYGSRFALQSADSFAQAVGYPQAPLDDLLVFHVVFGKSVPDVSLNAVANLGYADCRFLAPVFPGDTLSARSTVIGLRENSNRKTGVVYVQTEGRNQHGAPVLAFKRWVMVHKFDAAAAAPPAQTPDLLPAVAPADLPIAPPFDATAYDTNLAGSPALWEDYAVGERIDHVDGMTIEEAEHMMATRLYQNTAKVHFDRVAQSYSRFGRRLVYGGHIISMARALSFNGLANACRIVGINAGSHTNPAFAGDTVYAWSEVLDKAETAAPGVGALRLRLVALKDMPAGDAFSLKGEDGRYQPNVLLDLDYWALMPRRVA